MLFEGSFHEAKNANLIIRYLSDETIYVLKPSQTEGTFQSILTQAAVVELAKQQPGRDLAAVILVRYRNKEEEERVKQNWNDLLKGAGFQRIVFLRGVSTDQIDGLSVVPYNSHRPPA